MVRIGPVGMRTSLREIGWPALTAASAMSAVPIEPNSLPSAPALALSSSLKFSNFARARLRRGQFRIRLGLEFVALRFELRDIGGSRHRRPAGRHQEIAGVARLHLDAIADLAEVRDLLQQYDIHVLARALVLIGVRQQRQEARAPDRELQLALIVRARAGDAARDDLAGLGDVALERRQILVVDLLDVIGRESAELLAAEKTCHVVLLT